MIRPARYTDTRELASFVEKFHKEKSNLGDIPIDRQSLTSFIDYHIGTSKHICYIHVSGDDGEITGFILGGLSPFPHNQKALWATDSMFIADKGGAELLKRFHAWAWANKAKRIFHGVSTGDTRADALYTAIGMERMGGMYSLAPATNT